MATQPEGKSINLTMDAAGVYREDVYTDRKVGTIRCLSPVKSDGTPDAGRTALFIGEAQKGFKEHLQSGGANSEA